MNAPREPRTEFDEVEALRSALAAAAHAVGALGERARGRRILLPNPAKKQTVLDLAQQMLVEYRRRSAVFGAYGLLFKDPAWLMILEIYVSDGTSAKLAQGEVLSRAGVPPSTGQRLIKYLGTRDLVRTGRQLGDNRKVYYELTEKARDLMTKFLEPMVQN